MTLDLSKAHIIGQHKPAKNDTSFPRIFVTNWLSPVHLTPGGGTLALKMIKPADVKKYFAEKHLDFYLYADAEIISKLTMISTIITGQQPEDPYASFESTVVDSVYQSANPGGLSMADRLRKIEPNETFVYVQIIIPDFNPAMISSVTVPKISWFWWEMTLTHDAATKKLLVST